MYTINPELCEYCGACKSACPTGAITSPAGTNYYSISDSCVECGACESQCGFGAISAE